jgi:hypothetical protein
VQVLESVQALESVQMVGSVQVSIHHHLHHKRTAQVRLQIN